MSFLRPLESIIVLFQHLFGMLMSGLVIFFSMAYGGSTVRVCGEFMEFGSSLVRVIWHSLSVLGSTLESFYFSGYPITDTSVMPRMEIQAQRLEFIGRKIDLPCRRSALLQGEDTPVALVEDCSGRYSSCTSRFPYASRQALDCLDPGR